MAVEVKGLDELKRKFAEIPKAMRSRVLRNALSAGARLVRDEAKRHVPLLKKKTAYRTRGTVRNAIRVRTSKADRRDGNVGVFINVKPLKQGEIRAFKAGGGGSGFKNPKDPYYWQWLEFGRKGRAGESARLRVQRIKGLVKGVRYRKALRAVAPMQAYKFLQKGALKLGNALTIFETSISKWMTGINNGGAIK